MIHPSRSHWLRPDLAWRLLPISTHQTAHCVTFLIKGKTSICIAHHMDQPPLMRCLVTNGSRPATQATAHSLRTQAWAATRLLARQRQSAVGLHLRNPSLMDYYSFNLPRRDDRLSRPCWLTDSGRFNHKVVTRPAVSLAQDRESTPAEPACFPMLRHQLIIPRTKCRDHW